MKYISVVALSFFIINCHAQVAPKKVNPKLDSLARLSQKLINNNQPDSLYVIMGEAFRKEVSQDKMKEVVIEIASQLGKWTGLEFQDITDGIAHYKATFAVAPLNFFISLDKQEKVETFLFKP